MSKGRTSRLWQKLLLHSRDGTGADRARVKVVAGLGNPGPRYDPTRHNVGWWVVDRFALDHDFGPFERERRAWESSRTVGSHVIRLIKPRNYMNRSGLALARVGENEGFDLARDLLVVSDDANLEVGRVRLRPKGGAGGHNGLKSVNAVLGTTGYARLRVGVGIKPAGVDLSSWVLSEMSAEDEDRITELLADLSRAVATWAEEGVEAAMNRFNR